MNKYKLTKYFIFTMVSLLLVTPLPLAAAEATAVCQIPEELIKGAPIEPDYSLAVTATELIRKTKQNRRMTLVDIRSPEEFERLRIPGSINVALYAVKTKVYLKAQPFVLVGAGFEWRDLETESKCLHQSGFKPSILCGGLVAWQSQGGLLEGDRLLVAIYRGVPAHLFLHEKDYENIKVFDVSPKPLPEAEILIPGTIYVKSIESLVKLSRQYGPTCRPLVLLNDRGNQNEKFDAALKKAGMSNAFYLKGGISGYRHFLENINLSWKSRAERIVTLGECGTCGSVSQEDQHVELESH